MPGTRCAGLAACDEDKKEDGGVRACGVCVCAWWLWACGLGLVQMHAFLELAGYRKMRRVAKIPCFSKNSNQK